MRSSLPLTAVSMLLVLLACVGCGAKKSGTHSAATTQADTTSTAQSASTATTARSGPCKAATPAAPKTGLKLGKPTLKLDPGKRWSAVVTTNCGSFTVALDVRHDPKTASSFVSLARKGFFDGLVFHRIVPDFVIQGGDPAGDGSGGPGYSIVEKPPASTRYTHGVVAMAKAGNEPDGASGSQFFVVTGADAGLPAQYAVLGKVTSGLGVVDAIGGLPLQSSDPQGSAPVDPVVMTSVKIQG